uniref:Phlebovirus glycoprotein G2 fusion domain-containing protein n=1 Tax=Panagrolaimus superbus TaxID=310955 RepID=A0A914Z436_9BILA
MSKLSKPIKASHLRNLHLGDPLAFEHEKSLKSSKESVSTEDKSPEKVHQMRTRRDPRQVMSVFRLNPAFVLICCLMSLFSSVLTERCPRNITLQKVYKSPCNLKRFAIYRYGSGYCWEEHSCNTVQSVSSFLNNNCEAEENCNCPSWAYACSGGFYNESRIGNSTAKYTKVKQLLTLQKPIYCAFKDDNPLCHHIAKKKELIQVQLLDDTLHFVSEMSLVHQQVHNESFKCIGGGSDGFDGPPEFCNTQGERCYVDASSVCVPTFIEKHFLQTSHGNVEIKAWGLVSQNVYLHKQPVFSDFKATCDKGTLEVKGTQIQDILQIDYLKGVEFVKAASKVTSLSIPKRLINTEQNATITLWRKGIRVASVVQLCKKTDICTLVSFGPEYIINNCTRWWQYCIIIMLIIVISLGLIELFFIFSRRKRGPRARFLKLLFEKFFKIKLFKRSAVNKAASPENIELVELSQDERRNENADASSSSTSQNTPPTPMIRYKASSLALSITICFMILSSVNSAHQVISFQAKNDYCIRNSAGIKSCQHNSVTHFTIMDSDNVEMLFEDDIKNPQASLSVTVTPKATCQKGFSKFSRLVDIKVYSSKRCPASGSCIDDVCRTVSPNSIIPELTLVNMYPGVTQCTSSCGCWGCGCFLCYDSCTFFRFYAQPIDEIIYEEFSCRKWIMGADIETIFRSQGANKTENFHLEEGMVHELEHFKISLPAVRTSDVISFKNFIFDGKRIAFADEVSSKAMKLLSCNSKNAATKLQCKVREDACHCLPAGDGVNCICSQNHIIKKQLEGSFFPSEKAQIQVIDNTLSYALERATTDIIVETQHLDVVTIIDYNNCHLFHSVVQGCANCPSGAFILMACSSDFNKAFGVVECSESLKFSLLCDNNIHVVTTDFDHNVISLNCTLKCPANVENFNLNGTLQFIDEPFSYFNNTKYSSNITWYQATSTFFVKLLNSYSTVLIIIVIFVVVILLK